MAGPYCTTTGSPWPCDEYSQTYDRGEACLDKEIMEQWTKYTELQSHALVNPDIIDLYEHSWLRQQQRIRGGEIYSAEYMQRLLETP